MRKVFVFILSFAAFTAPEPVLQAAAEPTVINEPVQQRSCSDYWKEIRSIEVTAPYAGSIGLYKLALSPMENILATNAGKSILLWRLKTNRQISTVNYFKITTDALIYSLTFSPNGKTLAWGSENGNVNLWDIHENKLIRTLSGHTAQVSSLAFSPDSQTLASGSWDNTVKLWNIQTGNLITTLVGHTKHVNSVSFSPDGKTLASGSNDNTIILWDIPTGKCIITLFGHRDDVSSVVFSLDGKTLISGSYDKTIKLWDVSTERLQRLLTYEKDTLCSLLLGELPFEREIRSLTLSPDGTLLGVGLSDKPIILLDVQSFNEISKLNQVHPVNSLAFSPCGTILAATTFNGFILWKR